VSRWTASRPGFPIWRTADDLEQAAIAARGYPWQPADEIRRLQDSIEGRRRAVAAMLWKAATDRGPGAHATVGLLRRLAAREQAALEQEIAELLAWEVATGDEAGWEVELWMMRLLRLLSC
jgi:hypothetical protein